MSKEKKTPVSGTTYDDVYLVDAARTGFGEFSGTLSGISATDLGIAVARLLLERSGVSAGDIDMVVGANITPSDFDACYIPRHIGLYAGVPGEVPAIMVQRICASGFETLVQAADAIKLGKATAALCVGTECMSRNPVASFTMRKGFRLGQADFRDVLFESLHDSAPGIPMGGTAENLARKYSITRQQVDAFAARSFAAALAARDEGFHAGEIVPLVSQTFELEGHQTRKLRLPRGVESFATDEHLRPTTLEELEKLRPVFAEDGVQTAGNSSGIVDGAAAGIVAGGGLALAGGRRPMARILAAAAVGVPAEIMGIGPAPAIRGLLDLAGLGLDDIDRFEINEAFGAQYLAVEKELGLDRDKVNVNGGAIAIGHPLAATGVRCTLTLARELERRGLRYGVSSACVGGGQGSAVLIENPAVR